MTNPNDIQHGGDHYKRAGQSQHWDMLPVFGYGWEYYIGRATAYLTRVKQPDLDPKKAGHFVDKLIWLIDNGWVPPSFAPHTYRTKAELRHFLVDTYLPANNIRLTSPEACAITLLMFATNRADLVEAKTVIDRIEDNRTFVFGDDAIAAGSREE